MPLRYDFHRRVLSAGLLDGIAPPSRFHNGSRFRDSVPLRHGFLRRVLSAGLLNGIAPPSRFHNGSRFRDSVPLRNRIPLGPLPQALSSYTLSFFHLPKVRRFPVFSSHLPKVCGVATSSRALCVSVSPATVAFPPSKGAQISRVFVSPSEGARSRHCFESALCPCFSCGRAFPTFRRCAVFPRFSLTFRRCAVSGAADATILKRPGALCRKTSIAITRILVFLPLFNRK